MNKEKQIEEMANIIRCRAEQLPRCPHTTCCNCKATELYDKGYRKQSEVAREIFEEIESKKLFVRDRVGNMRVVVLFEDIAELKKKYTEEGE